jgi:hypothetical protein
MTVFYRETPSLPQSASDPATTPNSSGVTSRWRQSIERRSRSLSWFQTSDANEPTFRSVRSQACTFRP